MRLFHSFRFSCRTFSNDVTSRNPFVPKVYLLFEIIFTFWLYIPQFLLFALLFTLIHNKFCYSESVIFLFVHDFQMSFQWNDFLKNIFKLPRLVDTLVLVVIIASLLFFHLCCGGGLSKYEIRDELLHKLCYTIQRCA